MRIYKYDLNCIAGRCIIKMPATRTILSVQAQRDAIRVWAEVAPSVDEDVVFWLTMTGEVVPA